MDEYKQMPKKALEIANAFKKSKLVDGCCKGHGLEDGNQRACVCVCVCVCVYLVELLSKLQPRVRKMTIGKWLLKLSIIITDKGGGIGLEQADKHIFLGAWGKKKQYINRKVGDFFEINTQKDLRGDFFYKMVKFQC
jgi:hypothetical protein